MTAPVASPTGVPAGPVRRAGSLLAWLGVILIVSIAGAGLILSLDHAPTEQGRPELTARGHGIVEPRLAAIDADMQQLADAADAVAAAGRDTLTRTRALDVARSEDALATGDTVAADLGTTRDRVLAARATLLDGTSLQGLPASDRILDLGTIDAAIAAAGEIPGEWLQIAAVASGPLDLLRAMEAHDQHVVAATDSGRAGQWASALSSLEDAQQQLRLVRAVRETAHTAGADVSTLDDLLDRIDTYDQALIDLYTLERASDGDTSAETRAALARVEAAQASLPADQSAMVVIVSDLVGPAITPVLLSIESARGALEAAIDAQPQPSGTDPVPTDDGPASIDGVSS